MEHIIINKNLFLNIKLRFESILFRFILVYNDFKNWSMKNGVATLMHLPKGRVWKLDPSLRYKNAPRHRGVCIAIARREDAYSGFSLLLLKSNYPK